MMLGVLRPSRGNVRLLSEDPKNVQTIGAADVVILFV